MGLRCKPGDLAVTVGMVSPENNGVIVEVESVAGEDRYGVVWNVRHRTPMRVDSGPHVDRWTTNGEIHDCNLRPISGVPVHDEVNDEVTA